MGTQKDLYSSQIKSEHKVATVIHTQTSINLIQNLCQKWHNTKQPKKEVSSK